MIKTSLRAASVALALMLAPLPVMGAGVEHILIDKQQWPFAGFRGQFDAGQLQRGFQVYQENCSSCHGLKRLSFRNLVQPGGPEFPENSVKSLAAGWPNKITDGPNDKGKMFERPAKLSDPILGPHKNEAEARDAFNGALPPDFSVIAKARGIEPTAPWYTHIFLMMRDIATGYQEGGPDYIYALLTGYKNAPKDFNLSDGMSYNAAFPGHQIAMVPPLAKDNFVKYQDGKGSLEQNAKDVSAFLAWAADPSLNERKRIGWQVMLYLLVTTVLLFLAKKRIWSRIKH
ncbi:MAG: cytochrome c1 [Hyphomicrobium sp.]|nr:cytochrome c1 [Hyphomicrobium sp.]PPC80817.1 MAG: cytochrome c1 [Hyphomicrobium sp.]